MRSRRAGGNRWGGRVTAPLGGLVAALLAAGCATPSPAVPPPATPPGTRTFTVPPPATATGSTTVLVATSAPRSWPMPDLVGRNLQDAQDAIQELTGFEIPLTYSHDVTAAGREQLLDRNWRVCTQNVPAGQPITAHTRIDFGVARTEERC